MTEVRMPRLSDSMEEGTIVRWLRADGDLVAVGEALVEIETDKATMEYEAEAGGTLEILVAEGATVALGDAIARLLADGAPPASAPPEPAAQPESAQPEPAQLERAEPAPQRERPDRILATPVARRMASELGVDLRTVTATGRRGQIMKADIEAFAESSNGHGAAAEPEPEPGGAQSDTAGTREQLTRTQRTIARRMAESRAAVPDIELVVDIDMGACLSLRAQLAEHHSPAPSVNDLVIKACALALRALACACWHCACAYHPAQRLIPARRTSNASNQVVSALLSRSRARVTARSKPSASCILRAARSVPSRP